MEYRHTAMLSEHGTQELYSLCVFSSFGWDEHMCHPVSGGYHSSICIVPQKKHRKHRKMFPMTAGFSSQLERYQALKHSPSLDVRLSQAHKGLLMKSLTGITRT
jgi:hypothetical protein